MRLLFDTCLLLWAAAEDRRLPKNARALIDDYGNEVYFSMATIWEVAIKSALRREDFQAEPRWLHRGLLKAGYTLVPVEIDHILEVHRLPQLHRDPFDRMLRAQATVEALTLVTCDAVLASYAGNVAFV